AERLAVKVEVEPPRRAVTTAHAVKSELLREVAMRLGLEAVTEPVLAADENVQDRRAQVNEWHIETASVERDDVLVFPGHVPEGAQQFDLVRAGDQFHRRCFAGVRLEIVGQEQRLSAGGLRVEHGDAAHLRGERPEVELLKDFRPSGFAGGAIGKFFSLAEQVLPPGLIKVLHGKRRGFNVEDQFGHVERNGKRTMRQDGGPNAMRQDSPSSVKDNQTTSFSFQLFSLLF